ncbi:hypothetical protein GGI42DRAFT_322087 [Trichoderma sp. SZMC 28013]
MMRTFPSFASITYSFTATVAGIVVPGEKKKKRGTYDVFFYLIFFFMHLISRANAGLGNIFRSLDELRQFIIAFDACTTEQAS